MEQDYIGIIVSTGIYEQLVKGRRQNNVSVYQEAGEYYHLKPVFFHQNNLNPDVGFVQGFVKEGGKYKLVTVDIPKVVYTRSYLFNQNIKCLEEKNILLYNKIGFSYNKYKMHQILSKDPELSPFLPDTEEGTILNLNRMMTQYNHLILKPTGGSLGEGIMKLSKDDVQTWHLSYPIEKKKWMEITFKGEIPEIITNAFNKVPYIIQEKIELATYQDRNFDLRVVVQKNHTGKWVVASILCKVSPSKDQFVTNISKGGSALLLETVLEGHPYLSYSNVYEEVTELTLKLANYIEHFADHVADIAFDIALNTEGQPYFLETNFRGTYGTLKYHGKKYEEWKAKHFNPIGYGKFLLDQMKKSDK